MSENDREERLGWFDEVYRNAGDNPDAVPWQNTGPHPGLAYWAETARDHGGRAIDVGCGLGENAEFLARLGYAVTAFDLSTSAVDWARKRFPDSSVSYRQADLFALPGEWTAAFDLVNEIYTLQALPADMRQDALARIAALVAPGGRILVVCMGREEGEDPGENPPFPLARAEIERFVRAGLIETAFEDIVLGENERRHFIAVYSRPL